ncbi:hypothetical protein FKQ62_12685 [Vibrio sp. B1-2]|nr:hypothetical protein [Vibrio sp. 2-2(8)]NNO00297.1 hypothetical protein [Vibrio sp. B1-2]
MLLGRQLFLVAQKKPRLYTTNYLYNKAFKSDSQRLAFFIPSLGSVFTVVWLGFVVALLTP